MSVGVNYMGMTKNTNGKQDAMILKTLNDLMPKSHIVRKIERHLDLTFIYEEVNHLYSEMGQKGLDPVVFFKILLIRYMFGIKSIRETMRQIEINLAYRWYLGLNFDELVPHHSTMTQIYKRKFADSDIFEKIFLRIIELAGESGYIDYETIYAGASQNLSFFQLSRISEILEGANGLIDHVKDYVSSRPIGRMGDSLVQYSLLETEEGLVIAVGDVRTHGILTTLTVIATGVRVVFATNALSVMGATFSVAGIFMNKNHHMKPANV